MQYLSAIRKRTGQLLLATGAAATLWAGEPASDRAAEPGPRDFVRQLNAAFTEVVEEVSPSVVVLDVSRASLALAAPRAAPHPLWEFLPPEFRRQFEGGADPDRRIRGQGSGVIIRQDGYILTNGHVVEHAERIRVRFFDGREFPGTVRGVDRQSDLAVVKIEATGLPAARLADSDAVKVGEFAIAIGAPFDLEYSVTFGHVSAKGRSSIIDDESMDQDFLQTDANINPGNSGGPLVNIEGEVIGINTMIRGLHTGIGFAIPSNLAREIAAQLIDQGRFVRAWLGVEILGLRDFPAYRHRLPAAEQGVVVTGILRHGPAAKSDLRLGDLITTVGGRPVRTAQELKNAVRSKPVDQPLDLEVLRDRERRVVRILPEEWPEGMLAGSPPSFPQEPGLSETGGLGLTPLSSEQARQYGLDFAEGLVVTELDPSGSAARSGLLLGDVLTEADGRRLERVQDYARALEEANPSRGVLLTIVRDRVSRLLLLKDPGK